MTLINMIFNTLGFLTITAILAVVVYKIASKLIDIFL